MKNHKNEQVSIVSVDYDDTRGEYIATIDNLTQDANSTSTLDCRYLRPENDGEREDLAELKRFAKSRAQ